MIQTTQLIAAGLAVLSGITWAFASQVPLHIGEWHTEKVAADVKLSARLNALAAILTAFSGFAQAFALYLQS